MSELKTVLKDFGFSDELLDQIIEKDFGQKYEPIEMRFEHHYIIPPKIWTAG